MFGTENSGWLSQEFRTNKHKPPYGTENDSQRQLNFRTKTHKSPYSTEIHRLKQLHLLPFSHILHVDVGDHHALSVAAAFMLGLKVLHAAAKA